MQGATFDSFYHENVSACGLDLWTWTCDACFGLLTLIWSGSGEAWLLMLLKQCARAIFELEVWLSCSRQKLRGKQGLVIRCAVQCTPL